MISYQISDETSLPLSPPLLLKKVQLAVKLTFSIESYAGDVALVPEVGGVGVQNNNERRDFWNLKKVSYNSERVHILHNVKQILILN